MLRKWRYAFYLARTFFMLISYHFSSKSTEGESGLRVEEYPLSDYKLHH